MYLQTYIIVSNVTYCIACNFFKATESKSIQRIIAYQNSCKNFMYLNALSIFLSFVFNIKRLPVASNNSLVFDIFTVVWWSFMSEFIFTILHRLLHTKQLYWIHKQHHKNNPSFSTSSLDCHPLEFFFCNTLSIALPIYMFPASNIIGLLWIIFVTVNTCYAHHTEGIHMIHHKKFRYNYGQGSYALDRLCGTYVDIDNKKDN